MFCETNRQKIIRYLALCDIAIVLREDLTLDSPIMTSI